MNILINRTRNHTNAPANLLIKFFKEYEGKKYFSLGTALGELEQLEIEARKETRKETREETREETQDKEILLKRFLCEDIIFTSVYATFYEQFLVSIKENSELATALIHQFEEDTAKREQIILEISESHLRFIESGGSCPGCVHCRDHHDVSELIIPWKKNNIEFFIKLYLGMQTIFHTMKKFIFHELLFNHQKYAKALTPKNILEFRRHIYTYVSESLS